MKLRAIIIQKFEVILFTFILSSIFLKLNAQTYPLSDPLNTGNWVLMQNVSDEFNTVTLNEDKWHIQGKNGFYQSNFIGRQPSQFSIDNAIINNDKLKIQTKWEPNYPFSNICRTEGGVERCFENITTAAVISKELFHYGYMEIKSKAAKARVTSSFWTTGTRSELDMFEMFGNPQVGEANINWKKRLKFNMISWDPSNFYYLPDGNGPAHTRNIQANDNTADGFHVYGFDWTSEYIKVYIDGVLHPNGTILRSELGEDRWVTNVPYRLWFDSEVFWWLGIPEESDFNNPVEYEIEYIRVWQKNNLINGDFFGFENTIEIDGSPTNWYIDNNAGSSPLTIGAEKSYRWNNSLKFEHSGILSTNAIAFSPKKSIELQSGNYNIEFKLWLEPNFAVNNIQIVLDDPSNILNFSTISLETGKWITLSQNFTQNSISGDNARLRVRVRPEDMVLGSTTFFIDDINVNALNALNTKQNNLSESSSSVYPNPVNSLTNNYINISTLYSSRITLRDVTGAILHTIEENKPHYKIPTNNLSNGLYFITIESIKGIETKKILIK